MNKMRQVALLSGVLGLLLNGAAQAQDPIREGKPEQAKSIWSSVWTVASDVANLGGLFVKSLFVDINLEGEIRRPVLNESGEIHAYEMVKTAPAMFPLREILDAGKGVGSYFYTTPPLQLAKDAGQALVSVKDFIKKNPGQSAGHALFVVGYGLDYSAGEWMKLAGKTATYVGNKLSRGRSIHSYAALPAGLILASAIRNDQISEKTAQRLVGLGTIAYILGEVAVDAAGLPLDSLGAYQKKYSGGPCSSKEIIEVFQNGNGFMNWLFGRNVMKCLTEGEDLDSCRRMISPSQLEKKAVTARFIAFARHVQDEAASRIVYDSEGAGVCYQTALKPQDPNSLVTETCYPIAGSPEYTVRVLEGVSMSHFLKGIQPGEIAPVIELSSQNGQKCALHDIRQHLKSIGTHKSCTLSAPSATGLVTEMCIDLEHPDRHEVREASAKLTSWFRYKMKEQEVSGPGPRSIVVDSNFETSFTCSPPEGSFRGSCNFTVKPYLSSDPSVPFDTCELEANCSTIIPSIPPQKNSLHYAAGSSIQLGNQNGTLTILDDSGKESSLSAMKNVTCKPLPGSHKLSCEISVKPYVSTDPNLNTTPFCELTSNCKDVHKGHRSGNTVYYAHEHLRGTDVALENCNGRVVIHNTKKFDGMCAGKHPEYIEQIADEKGQKLHVLKAKEQDEL